MAIFSRPMDKMLVKKKKKIENSPQNPSIYL